MDEDNTQLGNLIWQDKPMKLNWWFVFLTILSILRNHSEVEESAHHNIIRHAWLSTIKKPSCSWTVYHDSAKHSVVEDVSEISLYACISRLMLVVASLQAIYLYIMIWIYFCISFNWLEEYACYFYVLKYSLDSII